MFCLDRFLVVIFAALVLSVRYACQFDQIFDLLERNYPAFMEENVVTLEEFGVVKFPSSAWARGASCVFGSSTENCLPKRKLTLIE